MFYGLSDLAFYGYFIVFGIAILFSWIVPGWVVLTHVKFAHSLTRLLVSIPLGMVLWGLQGYFLGYLGLRFLSIGFVGLFALVFWWQNHQHFSQLIQLFFERIKKLPLWLLVTVLASSFLQIFGHIGSGLRSAKGVWFYFVNAADGVLHLSYIQHISQTFPPEEPGAVGMPLVNYHYWTDLVMADLARVWHVPVAQLFFQYLPVLVAVASTLLFIKVLKTLGGNQKVIALGLFLFTLGGDLAYLITKILHGHWGHEVSALDSGVSFFFNFPQALARLVFLGALLLLIEWRRSKRWQVGFVMAIMLATLFGFKIYYGLYAVLGLGFLLSAESFLALIKNAKNHSFSKAVWQTVKAQLSALGIVTVLGIVALSIYVPVNKNAGGLYYSFFAWPLLLLGTVNLNIEIWWLRMQVYVAAQNQLAIFALHIFAVCITFLAVYGTRMIGMVPLFKPKGLAWQTLLFFFLPTNLVFILLGLFALQTSGGLNIFNFLIVPILSFIIIAAFNLSHVPTKIFLPVAVLFCVFTFPKSYFQLSEYWDRYQRHDGDHFITTAELEGFAYLRAHTPLTAVVQTPLSNQQDQLTPYMSFMTNRSSYLAGINMLESHSQPTTERLQKVTAAFGVVGVEQKNQALAKLGITYLALTPQELIGLGYQTSDAIFINDGLAIVKTLTE